MDEWIIWVAFWCADIQAFVCEESLCEVITINNSENSRVNIEILAKFQITPVVAFAWLGWVWKLMSLQEDSLWNTSVLNSGLNDVDCVIIKVVVDDALSDPKVLVWILNDWFLEVGFEM